MSFAWNDDELTPGDGGRSGEDWTAAGSGES